MAGIWNRSLYYRKKDGVWVDRHKRNVSKNRTGRPAIRRDLIKHVKASPVKPVQFYKRRR